MSGRKIYLITRGDDCGSNHSANKAIMETYKNGITKNISMMLVCPAILEAAEMFKDDKNFCCGLHVTLNAEWDNVKWGPVLPPDKVPTLVDRNGHFFSTPQKLYNNNPSLDEIMLEIQAQLDYALYLKMDIKYAEMHMGFGWVVDNLEEEFNRWCKTKGLVNGHQYNNPLPLPISGGDPVERLIAGFKAAENGVYSLVAHPAYDNDEMRNLGHDGYAGDVVATEREGDRQLFTNSCIIEYLKSNNVITLRYDEAEYL